MLDTTKAGASQRFSGFSPSARLTLLGSARLSTANGIKTAQVPDAFQPVDAALLCFAKTRCQRMFDVRIQRRLTDARWCSLIHSTHFSIAFEQPQVASGLEGGRGGGGGEAVELAGLLTFQHGNLTHQSWPKNTATRQQRTKSGGKGC